MDLLYKLRNLKLLCASFVRMDLCDSELVDYDQEAVHKPGHKTGSNRTNVITWGWKGWPLYEVEGGCKIGVSYVVC